MAPSLWSAGLGWLARNRPKELFQFLDISSLRGHPSFKTPLNGLILPRLGSIIIVHVIRNCVINYNYNVIVIVIEYFVLT